MNSFIYGIIGGMITVTAIWSYLFYCHVKSRNPFAFGGLLMVIGFWFTTDANIHFFLADHQTVSEAVMFKKYLIVAFFLAGSIMFLVQSVRK